MRLGLRVGEGCERLHDKYMRDLNVPVLEADELWAFVGKKQGNRKPEDSYELGDSYTFLGIDATNKAIVSFVVGKRDGACADTFVADLRKRIVNRPQISTDGFRPYVEAIDRAFGSAVDYVQIVKEYKSTAAANAPAKRRYSPSRIINSTRTVICGDPDMRRASTSYVERTNLSVRMATKRFARLTLAHSKKLRNHCAAVALFVAHFNFCRVHDTLRMTPAMALGVTDHVWSIGELIEQALATEPEPEAPITPPSGPSSPHSKWRGMDEDKIPEVTRAPGTGRPRLTVIKGRD